MKYQEEFRDPKLAKKLFAEIAAITTRKWAIMEVCGGQTHSIIRNGIDQLLPDKIELIHGPGCPVCVTPLELIDKALAIAAKPNVIFCSFGDMLRVPGSEKDLFRIKSEGGDIRTVYSPLDAVKFAREILIARLSFSESVVKRPLQPMRWRCFWLNSRIYRTFRCWFRTFSCRRRLPQLWNRRLIACKVFSPPDMFVR